MSEHTKGPWAVDGWCTDAIIHGIPNPRFSGGIEYFRIAKCNYANKGNHEIDTANAKLISKCPEMYDLIKKISNLNENAGEIGEGMLKQLVQEAREIIGK